MKRRITAILSAVMLVCAMCLPASALEEETFQTTEIINTECGDVEIDTTLIVHDSLFRSDTKSASIIRTVKYGGAVIAEITLSATFGYNGSSAWVVSTDSSHDTSGGWSYQSEKITHSGNTAKLTATLIHPSEGKIPISLSISCSPSGQIS